MSQSSHIIGGMLVLVAAIVPCAGCDSTTATANSSRGASTTPKTAAGEVDVHAASANNQSQAEKRGSAPNRVASKPNPTTGRAVVKTFDDLKFEMELGETFQREMLTREIEDLAGKRISIRGYILPTYQSRGIKTFVLVRDNMECCFGPGAALYDCILVEMQPGKTAEYSVRPVTVQGTFHIDLKRDLDGVLLAIYRMDGESVER
jgi:hypothetical protein